MTHCGYCLRPLTEVEPGRWECPVCAPQLRTMRAPSYPALLETFAAFVRGALAPLAEQAGQGRLL